MLTVASYLKGIPPKNRNPEKPEVLINFIKGVNAVGDIGKVVDEWKVIDSDVAVVQGFVHPGSKNVTHLNLRKNVFDTQQKNNKRSIIIDSNLFLYADPGNTKKYLRYSYDGIFPTTGEYCNSQPTLNRWDQISKDLNLSLKPWSTNKEVILICCQRDGGWSMDGQQLMPWLVKTIMKIKKYSDRKIVVRFHPGDRNSSKHKSALLRYNLQNVFVTSNESILTDFKTAHVVVNYNSSPAVAAAIEGIPVFVLDLERSQAKDIANTDISKIENPILYDRNVWIQKLAQMHWTSNELTDGTAWRHLRQWAKK
jgi:hypothetical protein